MTTTNTKTGATTTDYKGPQPYVVRLTKPMLYSVSCDDNTQTPQRWAVTRHIDRDTKRYKYLTLKTALAGIAKSGSIGRPVEVVIVPQTGYLTCGEMTVRHMLVCTTSPTTTTTEAYEFFPAQGYSTDGGLYKIQDQDKTRGSRFENPTVNPQIDYASDVSVDWSARRLIAINYLVTKGARQWSDIGNLADILRSINAVDKAFVVAAEKAKLRPVLSETVCQFNSEIPFESGRKYELVEFTINPTSGNARILFRLRINETARHAFLRTNMASEVLSKWLTFPANQALVDPINTFQQEALMYLATMMCVLNDKDPITISEQWVDDNINRFQLVGLTGTLDPPREGIREYVSQCKMKHVRLVMNTDVYPPTARGIAIEIGLIDERESGEPPICMTGGEYQDLTGEALADASAKLKVLSRSGPQHIPILCKQLLQQNHSVTLVYDEVDFNFFDMPRAMREANVRFTFNYHDRSPGTVYCVYEADGLTYPWAPPSIP